MQKNWKELPPVDPQPDLLQWLAEWQGATGDDPGRPVDRGVQILAQTLHRRGFHTLEQTRQFMLAEAYQPAPADELPGMQIAVDRLWQAIDKGETILVWGDFDVDGQTSTSLLVSALRQLGGKVRWHIPVRANESHGVNVPVLSRLLDDHDQDRISLVLTCDTGISAVEAVDYANRQGVQVLVTDHHELPPALPEALALINPNFLPEEHPLHSLPGVGVAYKLAEALFAAAGRGLEVEQFLDLAAVGCVADVALLRGETRYLVQRGLQLLAERQRLGLRLMLEAADVPLGLVNEQVIAFTLAPRLNSLGRLDDANPVVDFLTGEDEGLARVFVARLEALNARRQLLTSQTLQGALAQIEREPELLDDPILLLSHPAWPAGVVGIVANRLVEQFGKPAILLAAPPGEAAHGSARSVEGFDITAALRWVQETTAAAAESSADPGAIFYGYGGHRMAAGMSLPAERIPELRQRLRQAAALQDLQQMSLPIDAFLEFSELSLELVNQLERLAPFGAGNPPLVFATQNLEVVQATRIGRGQEHLRLLLRDSQGLEKEALWWQSADLAGSLDLRSGLVDLAYELRASNYGGQDRLQLTWKDFRPAIQAETGESLLRRQVLDHRMELHPLPSLRSILAKQPAAQVWAEAEAVTALRKQFPQAKLVDRKTFEPAPVLVIWTPPCSRAELTHALNLVQPDTVYLFNLPPEAERINPFLQRLAGLVKYTLRTRQGRVELGQLAVATGQTLLAVRLGLDWLATKGYIAIQDDQGEQLIIVPLEGRPGDMDGSANDANTELEELSSKPRDESPENLAAQIEILLQEAAAFRGYYRRADQDRLIS